MTLDLGSTGTDPARDRIVEIAALRIAPDGSWHEFLTLVNPGVPVPPGSTAVHGLGDADVTDAPTFDSIADGLADFLAGCDIAGFGVASFDLPLLAAEFARSGVPFGVGGRRVIDALAVYRRHEPRDLAHAVALYLGRGHADAHTAGADARAALEILDAQVRRYALPGRPGELAALFAGADAAGRFVRGRDGRVAFAFGKHRGRALSEVARADPGYLKWMLGQAFLDDTLDLVHGALAAAE